MLPRIGRPHDQLLIEGDLDSRHRRAGHRSHPVAGGHFGGGRDQRRRSVGAGGGGGVAGAAVTGGGSDSGGGRTFRSGGPPVAVSGPGSGFGGAGTGAGAAFGRGVYFAESSSKADQYAVANSDGKLYMFVSRVCLGRCRVVRRARAAAPFLPEVAGVSTSEVPVYYDSILADMPGRSFREIVVGKDSNAYPELLVEYERG